MKAFDEAFEDEGHGDSEFDENVVVDASSSDETSVKESIVDDDDDDEKDEEKVVQGVNVCARD